MKHFLAAIFIFATLSCPSVYADGETDIALPPWIVKVSSVYRADDGRLVRIAGTGTIVQMGEKFFVLCSSHLSQGAERSVAISTAGPYSDSLKIRQGARLADNISDVELIEIENPKVGGVFQFDPVSKEFTLPMEQSKGIPYPRIPVSGYDYFVPDVPWTKDNPRRWRKRAELPQRWFEAESTHMRRDAGPVSTYMDRENYVDAGIRAGESGSPLIKADKNNGRYILSGLAKAYHRYFDISYFTTRNQISNLVTAYSDGKRGALDRVRWRYGRFTYRDLGNDTLETSDGREPSGDSTTVDIGNGTSGDAGNGTSGDAGNGTSGDAGGGQRDPALKPISQGMLYEGNPIIGFRIEEKGESAAIYADLAGWRIAEDARKSGKKVEPIPSDADLSSLARFKISHAPAEPRPLTPKSSTKGACYIDASALKMGELKIRLPYDPASPDKPVTLSIPLKSAPSFLHFKSSSGEPFTVDLRGIFFGVASSMQGDGGIFSGQIEQEWSTRPYIVMQRGQYLADNFFCFPSSTFTFWGSEMVTLDQIRKQKAEMPCLEQPEVSGVLLDLSGAVAGALDKIEDASPLYSGKAEDKQFELTWDPKMGGRVLKFGRKLFTEEPRTKKDPSLFVGVDGPGDFSDVVYLIPTPSRISEPVYELDEVLNTSHLTKVIRQHGCTDAPLHKQSSLLVHITYRDREQDFGREVDIYCLKKAESGI